MISAYYLFCKYINFGSLAEINIGHSVRQKLTDVFGENANEFDDDKLFEYIQKRMNTKLLNNKREQKTTILDEINAFYNIFNESCEEMTMLLKFSFARFTDTALYKK